MFLFHKKSMIYSPCDGTFKPLSEVKDEVFSKELMGKGFAVVPTNGDIHSPVESHNGISNQTCDWDYR